MSPVLTIGSLIGIRNMHPYDWEQVKKIYESGISTGLATFETTAPGWQDWDSQHLKIGRLVCLRQNEIAGWAALSPVSDRCVYKGLAEVSIYVSEKYRGYGIGKHLLQQLAWVSEANGFWILQAGIIAENKASIRLHEQSGFRSIGYREKLGKLRGEWKDVVMMERRSKLVGID